jgi:hypothetical protein
VPIQGFEILTTYLLGPLLRNSFCVCSVCNERKFRKLQASLLRKFRPSAWSFLSGGQAFNIRSTDAWWQLCVQLLMYSCDVIVVDLSKVKSGTEWEIEELLYRGLLHKCLFVTGDEYLADAGQIMERYFPDQEPPIVHLYRNTGKLANTKTFDTHLQALIEPAIATWHQRAA